MEILEELMKVTPPRAYKKSSSLNRTRAFINRTIAYGIEMTLALRLPPP